MDPFRLDSHNGAALEEFHPGVKGVEPVGWWSARRRAETGDGAAVSDGTGFDDEARRPWGHYEVLADGGDHKVKRIVVLPGRRLSLQRHRRRSEHWHLVRGEAVVTVDEARIRLGSGESVDIPLGSAHRIENVGEADLVFIEIQSGSYFGEDDIERLEDDWGRC